MGGNAVRVAFVLDVLDGGHQREHDFLDGLVELHPLHHQVTTCVGQLGDVVDVDRARLHTRVAGRAREDGVFANACDQVFLGRAAREQNGRMVVRVVADVVDDLHRVEGLP